MQLSWVMLYSGALRAGRLGYQWPLLLTAALAAHSSPSCQQPYGCCIGTTEMKFAGVVQVMPVLFGVMRSSDDALRDFLFQQLTVLVSFLRQHVRKYLPDILSLVHDYWIPTSALMPHILRLLSELSGEHGFLLNLKPYSCTMPYACSQSCQVNKASC